MAAHGICFDFYYWAKPSQIGQNGSAAAADARLAANRTQIHVCPRKLFEKKKFRVLSTYNFACRLVVVDVVVSRSMISLPLPPFSKL